MNDIEQLTLLYETMQMSRTGSRTINKEDISNSLFKATDGGREMFTVYTVRKNDSRTDSSKRAGMEMKITGKLGACRASYAHAQERRPELDTKVQYAKNLVLRVYVTSVDGVNYLSKPAHERTRSFKVNNIRRIEAGGKHT
jgi:hypothetical protein